MPPIDVLSAQERLVLELRGLYEGYGYARFPMRRFEEYALYLENKSFLQSERVLSFTNANGRLMALKPDVTLSIVKHARADKRGVEKLYYNESVYRVSPTDHEFTEIEQIGIEYLGDVDDYGICEVLRLAVESLRLIGLPYALDVSHMGFAGGLMAEAGLSAENREAAFRLIRQRSAHELRAALDRFGVAPFFAERITALTSLSGGMRETLEKAAALAVGAEMEQAVGELRRALSALDALGLADHVRLDFSIVNDLDYYNGLVFQGYVSGAPRMVLGGGRYDNLMRRFGKAGDGLGFALYLDELSRVLTDPAHSDADALLLYADGDDPAWVLRTLERLRLSGGRVLAAKAMPEGMRVGRVVLFAQEAAKEAGKDA